jgi:diguanylate cyclase (GGDEF)-like protein
MGLGRTSSAGGPDVSADARSSHEVEQRSETRRTTLVAGGIAMAALPAWAAFDRLVMPAQAPSFLVARLLSMGAVALVCLALWWRPVGERFPEVLSLLAVLTVELTIAWMIPRATGQLEAYLLGMSLAIYATAFLVVWRWWMGAVLAVTTAVALTAFSATAPVGLDRRQTTIAAFYLGTAMALSLVSQVYRERQRWQHHLTQAALEHERCRNEILVDELEQLSREDPLTSVGNRRAWDERLTAEYLVARRSGRPLSVLIVDIDRFKSINDLGGHILGDSALRAIAVVLSEAAGSQHFVARPGGDEFAVLCPDTSLAAAAELAAGIHAALPGDPLLHRLSITCSIGAAELEREDRSTASLYRRADAAMYEAKAVRGATRCAEPGQQGSRPAPRS